MVALAICSSAVIAQGTTVSKKFENASPEVRQAMGLPPTAQSEVPAVSIDMLRNAAAPDAATCAGVKVSAPVTFRGRVLKEIPDITEPQLRLANQLMSNGCFVRAIDNLEKVVRAQPGNRNARYVVARLTWFLLNTPMAEQELNRTLQQYPDFASAKVLLVGVRFEQRRLQEVESLLAEVEPRSPTDLWIYIDRLRLQAVDAPTRDLRTQLLEIVRNPGFPPNAREQAAVIAKRLPNQTEAEYQEVLRARLEISSGVQMACKVSQLAFELGDGQQQFDEVVKLLESPKATEGNCLGLQDNRTMLAQAYLMQAAKLNARPTAANRSLIEKANLLLNGDFTSVAMHAQGRPQYPALKPFLDVYVNPLEESKDGVTRLCHAISLLDAEAVREALEAGADPKGRCRDESLVGSLVFMATTEKVEERRAVMQVLLEHAAPVTNLDACRSHDMGDCSEVLLPLMEKYARKSK